MIRIHVINVMRFLNRVGSECGRNRVRSDNGGDDDDRIHMSHAELHELLGKLRQKGSRGSVNLPKTTYCEFSSCRYVSCVMPGFLA